MRHFNFKIIIAIALEEYNQQKGDASENIPIRIMLIMTDRREGERIEIVMERDQDIASVIRMRSES